MKPELVHNGPTPIYLQVERWIKQQIEQGYWPEHYKLVNEIDLADELGVSRGTVRKAISNLIHEGLLVRIHGKGTFVASKHLEQPLAERLVAFSESLIEQNIPFETHVLAKNLVVPDSRVASLLSVPAGSKVFHLERVRFVAREPIIYSNNYVVVQHCPGIEDIDFTQYRLFQVLESHYKLKLDWGRRTFEAQVADEKVASLLHIPVCGPIMKLEQIVYLDDGSPIEFSDVCLRGDRFSLTSTVKRSGARENTVRSASS